MSIWIFLVLCALIGLSYAFVPNSWRWGRWAHGYVCGWLVAFLSHYIH